MHITQGLLQSEVEGVDNESVGFYGRCVLHATYPTTGCACDPINSEIGCHGEKEFACARTEVFCQLIEVFFLRFFCFCFIWERNRGVFFFFFGGGGGFGGAFCSLRT